MCVWKKGKDTGFGPKLDSCVCHAITAVGSVPGEEKNPNALVPLLLKLSDKGLGTHWRHHLSEGLGKAL